MTTRQALVVRGGWEGHTPVQATDLFIPYLEEQGFSVRVESSPEVYADADAMAATDVIVQCVTMSTIERDQLEGLRTAVANGTGMAGWHGGIADSFRNSSDYLHLVGGQFACHPGKPEDERVGDGSDNFVPYRVEFNEAAASHPITEGLEDFDVVTEQYWVLADDYIDVLATTTQKVLPYGTWNRPVVSPAVWTRQWGKGRIAIITPGHSIDVLEHPTVSTLVKRSMLWAAR